jgi:hypothetical protein
MGDAPGFSAGAQFESRKEQRQEDPVTDNTVDAAAPDTIVLIHGLWMTPRRRTQHAPQPEHSRVDAGGD